MFLRRGKQFSQEGTFVSVLSVTHTHTHPTAGSMQGTDGAQAYRGRCPIVLGSLMVPSSRSGSENKLQSSLLRGGLPQWSMPGPQSCPSPACYGVTLLLWASVLLSVKWGRIRDVMRWKEKGIYSQELLV